jgi:hypothetical protein
VTWHTARKADPNSLPFLIPQGFSMHLVTFDFAEARDLQHINKASQPYVLARSSSLAQSIAARWGFAPVTSADALRCRHSRALHVATDNAMRCEKLIGLQYS